MENILPSHLDGSFLGLGFSNHLLEAHLLEVKDDVSYIFLDARNSCKLMLHAIDSDVADRKSLEG